MIKLRFDNGIVWVKSIEEAKRILALSYQLEPIIRFCRSVLPNRNKVQWQSIVICKKKKIIQGNVKKRGVTNFVLELLNNSQDGGRHAAIFRNRVWMAANLPIIVQLFREDSERTSLPLSFPLFRPSLQPIWRLSFARQWVSRVALSFNDDEAIREWGLRILRAKEKRRVRVEYFIEKPREKIITSERTYS